MILNTYLYHNQNNTNNDNNSNITIYINTIYITIIGFTIIIFLIIIYFRDYICDIIQILLNYLLNIL